MAMIHGGELGMVIATRSPASMPSPESAAANAADLARACP
jgi:hypothetical protein